jgi:hypothetical protein
MMMYRRSTKGGILLETLLLLVSFALLAEGFMSGADNLKLSNGGQPTDGVITGVNGSGFGYYVQFNAGPTDQRVFEQDGPALGKKIGDQVPVVYDPANPANAIVDRFSAVWFKAIILALGGFLVLIIAFRMHSRRSL